MSTPSDAPEQNAETDVYPTRRQSEPARAGAGSWIIILVLLLLLMATGVVACVGWTLEDDVQVPTVGYVAMAAGVLFSLIVGCGLMALVFYSSRSGYDEPPAFDQVEHQSEASRSSAERLKSHPTRSSRSRLV